MCRLSVTRNAGLTRFDLCPSKRREAPLSVKRRNLALGFWDTSERRRISSLLAVGRNSIAERHSDVPARSPPTSPPPFFCFLLAEERDTFFFQVLSSCLVDTARSRLLT